MRKAFTQRIAALSAMIGAALTAGATAGASTVASVAPTGAAPQAPVSQTAADTTPAGLGLVPVTDPALSSKRPAGVSANAALYVLRSGAGGNLCLDADTKTLGRNGTKIQLWTCTYQAPGGSAFNQLWWLPTIGTGFIQNYQSGRCLDADMGALGHVNGVKVQLWDCETEIDDPLSHNQVWQRQSPNELRNFSFGSCLNADGSAPRAIVHLWSCSPNGARDQWYPVL